MNEFWRLPANVSTFGGDIDGMFMLIAWIITIVFFGVEILLLWFLFRYRARPGQKAGYTHGNSRMEVLWTGATALIVLFIGVISRGLWLDVKDPDRFPEPGLQLIVSAKQFEWNTTYPGADGQLGTNDDFVRRNQMHVPVNTPVRVTLVSEDVIHSFYLPELRLKQDAVPGMQIPAWFQATQTGEYTVGCAELCGLQHYRMKGTLTVVSQDEFNAWTAQQIAAAAGAGDGTAPALASPGTTNEAAGSPVMAAASHAH
jgi:cytochrome c oxidase subunit 2